MRLCKKTYSHMIVVLLFSVFIVVITGAFTFSYATAGGIVTSDDGLNMRSRADSSVDKNIITT